jgi:CHASE1-domain containing sensor protein
MILIIVTVMIFVILLSLTLINTLRIGSIKDEQVDFMNKINNTLSRVHNELLSKYEEKKSIDSIDR